MTQKEGLLLYKNDTKRMKAGVKATTAAAKLQKKDIKYHKAAQVQGVQHAGVYSN